MLIPALNDTYSWYNEIIREKLDPSEYTTKSDSTHHNEQRLKLDQIMRVLFKLSKKVTLHMINELFHERFTSHQVDIEYGNSEFIQDDFERIVGDMFITIRDRQQVFRYHIEFQTLNDPSMVFRMFHYGFEKAKEQAIHQQQTNIIEFPRQLVIFLEENSAMDDTLEMVIRLPSGELIPYTVPVMKYWRYSAEDLQKVKMYALLPLQAFKSRKRIQAISNSKMSDAEKSRLITKQFAQLKVTIQQTIDVLGQLHDEQEIHTGDLERMLVVMQNINEYLYDKYGEYQMIKKEVYQMVRTLYDPRIEQQGIEKGIKEGIKEGELKLAKRLLSLGVDVDKILEAADLTEEEVKRLLEE